MEEYFLIKINNQLLYSPTTKFSSVLMDFKRDQMLSQRIDLIYQDKLQEAEVLYISDNLKRIRLAIGLKIKENSNLSVIKNFTIEPSNIKLNELLRSKITELENENSNLKMEINELKFGDVAFYHEVKVRTIERAFYEINFENDNNVKRISKSLVDESTSALNFCLNIREIFYQIFTEDQLTLYASSKCELEKKTQKELELLIKFKINMHNNFIIKYKREKFENLIKIKDVRGIFSKAKSEFSNVRALKRIV